MHIAQKTGIGQPRRTAQRRQYSIIGNVGSIFIWVKRFFSTFCTDIRQYFYERYHLVFSCVRDYDKDVKRSETNVLTVNHSEESEVNQ